MFSANENLMLRQFKRRIIGYVEETIPEDALDMGTTVMVMQVSCKAPGCVPLETLICVVFPKMGPQELIPNLPESADGGTFKTKVLKPMSDVTQQDVLEALPPEFKGGQRSMAKLCLQARDVMLAQITQIVGEDDLEGRQLMTQYLQQCLVDYMDRNCEPPQWGEEFPQQPNANESESGNENENDKDTVPVVALVEDEEEEKKDNNNNNNNKDTMTSQNDGSDDDKDNEEKTHDKSNNTTPATVVPKSGNFVIHRKISKEDDSTTSTPSEPTSITTTTTTTTSRTTTTSSRGGGRGAGFETSTDWRRRQTMERQMNFSSSQQNNIISRLAEREHEPGVRRPGCPCCDPDDPSNYFDSMAAL